MGNNLRDLLRIPESCVDEINALLLDPNNQAVNAFLEVVEKYGTPEEINRKATQFNERKEPVSERSEIIARVARERHFVESLRRRLMIMDIRGREVARLIDGAIRSGAKHVVWNAVGSSGNRVASGLYFCVLETNTQRIVRKVLLSR